MLLKETTDSQGLQSGLDCVSTFKADKTKIEPKLVAMGTFLNADTTRIIAKRIVLTGHPFKVHKKTATIRYMFFNPGAEPFELPIY